MQAALIFEALHRVGTVFDAVIFEPKSAMGKLQRIRAYVKRNGLPALFGKMGFVLSDKLEKWRRRRTEEQQINIAELVAKLDVPTYFVDNHNSSDCRALLTHLAPDLVLISGTRILKAHIIESAKVGCLNAHPGWLPEFRGLNANGWAFLEGGKLGATVHFVDTNIDTGDIVVRRELQLLPGDTMEDLERKGASLCAELTAEAVQRIESGDFAREKQTEGNGKQYFAMNFRQERHFRAQLRRYAKHEEK
jgi:methionyl-tRNA formyltransferase